MSIRIRKSGFRWGVCQPAPVVPGYVVVMRPDHFVVARNLVGEEFFLEETADAWVLYPPERFYITREGFQEAKPIRVSRLLALPDPAKRQVVFCFGRRGGRTWEQFRAAGIDPESFAEFVVHHPMTREVRIVTVASQMPAAP